MTRPNGHLWVDPEGVQVVGFAYGEHEGQYGSFIEWLTSIRSDGAAVWGDDDLGQQFSQTFVAGLVNLERLIGGVVGLLEFTSNGLVTSGKIYRTADDEATEYGFTLASSFASALPPGFGVGKHVVDHPPGEERPSRSGELLRLERGERRQGPLLAGKHVTDDVPSPTFLRSLKPAVLAEPGSFATAGVLHPLLSAGLTKLDFATAHVSGQPLPAGYQLVGFLPLADGAVYIDANKYDSVVPVSEASVTTPTGQPIDPGKTMLFVVKENPNVDPTTPGYESLVMRYPPDGVPTVVTTGR